jgi:SAM-dependent methyltransferase
MKLVNLACGAVYVATSDWSNVDFSSTACDVTCCDLLEKLPFENNSFDVVYSSHFLEHIPRSAVKDFLLECRRILRPGGIIRLVLPDCEEMFSAFLDLRAQGMHKEADFVLVEIVDQCVRPRSGGELGAFYNRIRHMEGSERTYWQAFAAKRVGEGLDPAIPCSHRLEGGQPSRIVNEFMRDMSNKVYSRLRLELHKLGIRLLLPSFRRQNVSFAVIGEKHCWLWDFHQLKNELEDAGFSHVIRESHYSSSISGFPFVPLDSTKDGRPRKGVESMFVEARL